MKMFVLLMVIAFSSVVNAADSAAASLPGPGVVLEKPCGTYGPQEFCIASVVPEGNKKIHMYLTEYAKKGQKKTLVSVVPVRAKTVNKGEENEGTLYEGISLRRLDSGLGEYSYSLTLDKKQEEVDETTKKAMATIQLKRIGQEPSLERPHQIEMIYKYPPPGVQLSPKQN